MKEKIAFVGWSITIVVGIVALCTQCYTLGIIEATKCLSSAERKLSGKSDRPHSTAEVPPTLTIVPAKILRLNLNAEARADMTWRMERSIMEIERNDQDSVVYYHSPLIEFPEKETPPRNISDLCIRAVTTDGTWWVSNSWRKE